MNPKNIKSEWLRKLVDPLYNKSGYISYPYQSVASVPELKNQNSQLTDLIEPLEHSILPPAPQAEAKTNIQPLVAVPDKKRSYAAGYSKKPYSGETSDCIKTLSEEEIQKCVSKPAVFHPLSKIHIPLSKTKICIQCKRILELHKFPKRRTKYLDRCKSCKQICRETHYNKKKRYNTN